VPRSVAIALGITAVLAARTALAQPAPPLRVDPAAGSAIVVGGTALLFAGEVAKGALAPKECRWCEPGALDVSARDALVWRDRATADRLSNLGAFALVPAATLGFTALAAHATSATDPVWLDAVVVAEAGVIAAGVNQVTKLVVARQRPSVRHGAAATADDNLSFYSGHTSLAFSLAVASGTVASLRGFQQAPAIWALGLSLASTVGYLRIAADRHYLTDTLVGALAGGAIGFVVPYVFHAPRPAPPAGGPAAGVAPGAAAATTDGPRFMLGGVW